MLMLFLCFSVLYQLPEDYLVAVQTLGAEDLAEQEKSSDAAGGEREKEEEEEEEDEEEDEEPSEEQSVELEELKATADAVPISATSGLIAQDDGTLFGRELGDQAVDEIGETPPAFHDAANIVDHKLVKDSMDQRFLPPELRNHRPRTSIFETANIDVIKVSFCIYQDRVQRLLLTAFC